MSQSTVAFDAPFDNALQHNSELNSNHQAYHEPPSTPIRLTSTFRVGAILTDNPQPQNVGCDARASTPRSPTAAGLYLVEALPSPAVQEWLESTRMGAVLTENHPLASSTSTWATCTPCSDSIPSTCRNEHTPGDAEDMGTRQEEEEKDTPISPCSPTHPRCSSCLTGLDINPFLTRTLRDMVRHESMSIQGRGSTAVADGENETPPVNLDADGNALPAACVCQPASTEAPAIELRAQAEPFTPHGMVMPSTEAESPQPPPVARYYSRFGSSDSPQPPSVAVLSLAPRPRHPIPIKQPVASVPMRVEASPRILGAETDRSTRNSTPGTETSSERDAHRHSKHTAKRSSQNSHLPRGWPGVCHSTTPVETHDPNGHVAILPSKPLRLHTASAGHSCSSHCQDMPALGISDTAAFPKEPRVAVEQLSQYVVGGEWRSRSAPLQSSRTPIRKNAAHPGSHGVNDGQPGISVQFVDTTDDGKFRDWIFPASGQTHSRSQPDGNDTQVPVVDWHEWPASHSGLVPDSPRTSVEFPTRATASRLLAVDSGLGNGIPPESPSLVSIPCQSLSDMLTTIKTIGEKVETLSANQRVEESNELEHLLSKLTAQACRLQDIQCDDETRSSASANPAREQDAIPRLHDAWSDLREDHFAASAALAQTITLEQEARAAFGKMHKLLVQQVAARAALGNKLIQDREAASKLSEEYQEEMSRLQAGRITHRQDAQEMQDLREKLAEVASERDDLRLRLVRVESELMLEREAASVVR